VWFCHCENLYCRQQTMENDSHSVSGLLRLHRRNDGFLLEVGLGGIRRTNGA
jgi:hypothetical protein